MAMSRRIFFFTSPSRRAAGGVLALVGAIVCSVAGVTSTTAAAPESAAAPAVTTQAVSNVEFTGAAWVPNFGTLRGGALALVGSPDHESLYHVSGFQLIDVDVASAAFTDAVGGNLDDWFEPSAQYVGILDVEVTSDGNTAYLLYSKQFSAPYHLWVRALDLTTGELGEPSIIATSTSQMGRGSLALSEGGASPVLYAYTSNYRPASTNMPTLFTVDPDTLAVTDSADLTGVGATVSTSFTLVASADGTELYAGTNDQIGVFDTTDFSSYSRIISQPGYSLVGFDDTPGTDDKGRLYAAAYYGTDLRIIDPDSGDAVTGTATLPTSASTISVDSSGNAVVGFGGSSGLVVVDGAAQVVASASGVSARPGIDPSGSVAASIWIDEDPTHGTCYFVSDGWFEDIAAYSVDGADCGGFGTRFDPIAGPIAVDGTATVTYDAVWSDRAEPWAGIVVFVDCQPARVIRPPLSGSEEIRWRDLPPGTSMQIRSYTATQLDSLGVDLDDVTCSLSQTDSFGTLAAERLEVALDYLPLQATAVVGGDDYSCALAGGLAWCWGDGTSGTLGDGAPQVGVFLTWEDSAVFRPVALPGTVDSTTTPVTITADTSGGQLSATEIASYGDGRHVCALADSSIVCWGLNEDGQLGVGQTQAIVDDGIDAKDAPGGPLDLPNASGHVNVPVPAVASNGFTNTAVTAVAAGEGHSCAVDAGVAYCWGKNRRGQLGDGTVLDTNVAVEVVSGGGFTNTAVTALAAGFDHTCAIEAGSVYCWGRNSSGSLGDNTTTDSLVPVKVLDNDGFVNTGVTDVIATDRATCAVASGSVYCWGEDDAGMLGDGDPAYQNSSLPKKVIDVPAEGFTNTGITAIGGGQNHVCAVTGGSVFCWGANGDDQLGFNGEFSYSSAVKVPDAIDTETGETIFANTGVLAVGGGAGHTCAATEAGAFCWGENNDGRLGRGTLTGGVLLPGPVCCSALPVVELTVDVEGDGSVTSDVGPIDCPGTCSAEYVVDDVVVLTAAPDAGFVFVGWGGACSGTSACSVTMSDARSVTATFGAPPQVDLRVVISGNGSVTIGGASCTSTCTVPVDPDTQVTLTAVPQPGFVFLGWGGPCSGTGVCVVSLAAAGQVTASFGPVPTLPATGGSGWLSLMALGLFGIGVLLLLGPGRRRQPVEG